MGILDEIEKIDEEESLKATLKRIERLQEENNRMLKEILKRIRRSSGSQSKKKER